MAVASLVIVIVGGSEGVAPKLLATEKRNGGSAGLETGDLARPSVCCSLVYSISDPINPPRCSDIPRQCKPTPQKLDHISYYNDWYARLKQHISYYDN